MQLVGGWKLSVIPNGGDVNRCGADSSGTGRVALSLLGEKGRCMCVRVGAW